MKNLIAASMLCAATGCTGMNYAIENYADVELQHIEHDGKTWRIFDKSAEGRLMITPSNADAAGSGMASGITLGLARSPYLREATFTPTVQAYLSQKYGRCEITHADLVIEPQYEFFYEC